MIDTRLEELKEANESLASTIDYLKQSIDKLEEKIEEFNYSTELKRRMLEMMKEEK